MERVYFDNAHDGGWIAEVLKIVPWLDGVGLDVGCGNRSIFRDNVLLDLDPEWEPDVLAAGDAIPFPTGQFDYLYSIHSFEHFKDQEKTLKEWLRVVRKGGIIAIIHPDIDYTKPQKPPAENVISAKKPLYIHQHERNQKDFMSWITPRQKMGFKVVDSGVAWEGWSFYVILQKT